MPVYASTVLARSTTALLSHITCLSKRYSDHTLLFALSPTVNASELSRLVLALTTFSPQTIGCLSAPLPGIGSESLISCSLAVFENRHSVVFRSTIPGKASPQVGRWHAFRKRGDVLPPKTERLPEGPFDWDDIWGRNAGNNALPLELRKLSPKDIDAVIYFSDRSSEGLSNSLAAFPQAIKLGLIATSTPFVTGRPVTLFHNDRIYDSGAVGLALTQRPDIKSRVDSPGVKPLSPPMTVTRSEGNLINELDNKNPTQLLLAAIRKAGIHIDSSGSLKDQEIFSLGSLRRGTLNQIFNITSGDPARGTIALESDGAPSAGTQVQFLHRPKSAPLCIPKRFYEPHSDPSLRTLGFITSSESAPSTINPNSHATKHAEKEEIVHTLSQTFLAASENGFVLNQSGGADVTEADWKCTIPGELATLEWLSPSEGN